MAKGKAQLGGREIGGRKSFLAEESVDFDREFELLKFELELLSCLRRRRRRTEGSRLLSRTLRRKQHNFPDCVRCLATATFSFKQDTATFFIRTSIVQYS